MAYLNDIDESKPDGSSEKVSNLDNRIRECRDAVKNTVGAEHYLDTGEHKIPQGTTANRPTGKAGLLYLNTDNNNIEFYTDAWKSVGIPKNSRLLFAQDWVPEGWTFIDWWDDRVVVITNTLADGASTGGSWTITGISSAGSHQHASAGAHTHAIPMAREQDDYVDWMCEIEKFGTHSTETITPGGTHVRNVQSQSASGDAHPCMLTSSDGSHQHAAAGSHTHTFDGNWRPAYTKVICCSKD